MRLDCAVVLLANVVTLTIREQHLQNVIKYLQLCISRVKTKIRNLHLTNTISILLEIPCHNKSAEDGQGINKTTRIQE